MSLGIYIQVPFCQTKCTYCNFHTGVVARERYAPYADAVCREIAEHVREGGTAIDSLYIGGGTPSLLESEALARMIEALRRAYGFSAMEATLEADPETITPEKASAWLTAGFNRISMGSQSFNNRELQAAGRMHRRADIFQSAEFLREAGLRNISMDLIAGLPHQTSETWHDSVSQLIAIRPEHVSIYMLEIDDGSRLGKESLGGGVRYSAGAIPPDDAIANFYEDASVRLADAGYVHYEISNWALPGMESRHNLKYWQRQPYLGFGAGAHSFDGSRRWANVHDAARYVSHIGVGKSPREQIESVTPDQAFDEEIFLGLRQLEGIDLGRIEREYATNAASRVAGLAEQVERLRSQGFVKVDGKRVRLAPDKLTISNEVIVELLS